MAQSPLKFLREYLTEPKHIGAIAPSSRRLGHAMLSGFDLARTRTIVELGPGTGALTRTLLEEMPAGCRLVAIERSEEFARHLELHYPAVLVVHGDAEEMGKHLEKLDIPGVDLVVSGLPWASFDKELQERLLAAITSCLLPGGGFTTFAYSACAWTRRARAFRSLLTERFRAVSRTPVVWRNLPPAFAYQCFI